MIRFLGPLLIACVGLPSYAVASAGGLDVCVALLSPTQVAYSHSVAATFAYQAMHKADVSSQGSSGFGVAIPIYGVPVGINAKQDSSDTSSQIDNIGLDWSRNEQLSYLATFTPKTAGDQFNTCVANILNSRDSKVSIEAAQQSDLGITFTVSVHAVAIGGPVSRKLKIWTNGNTSESFQGRFGQLGGEAVLTIARPDPSKSLFIKATIETLQHDEINTETVEIPWQPIQLNVMHSPPGADVRCGGSGHWGLASSKNQVVFTAAPNEILFLDTINPYLGNGLPATTGNHPDKFPNGAADHGLAIDYISARQIVGHTWCRIDANENPGWYGTFSILGGQVSRPPSNGKSMVEHPVKSILY